MRKSLILSILLVAGICINPLKAQWTTSGTNIYNSNTGNVGIGKVPSYKLDVNGIINSNNDIVSTNGTINTMLSTTSTYTGGVVGTKTNHPFFIYTNSAPKMTIDAIGNVGIGTTAPGTTLDVNGEIRSSAILLRNTYTATIKNPINTDRCMSFETDVEAMRILGNGYVGIGTTSPETTLDVKGIIRSDGVNNALYLRNTFTAVIRNPINTDRCMSFETNVEAMRILGNGNVGIGTTSPEQPLDVVGTIRTNGSTNGIYLRNVYTSVIKNPSTTERQISFETNVEAMRILNNGNVGIGVTNPQYKLAVDGTIGAREIKVTTETWSDFVFKPNYKLRNLGEVELFIKANYHLPEIPTEKEIKENGVSLGEMNAKLLQKVEELTLYLIEMKKVNDNLTNRVTELEKKNKN